MNLPAYGAYKKAKTTWIEQIPSHWQEWKVNHGFRLIGSGTTPKSDSGLFYGGNTLWVTTAELRETFVYDTANKVTQEALDEHSALRVYPAGSVMIAMYGATIGRLGILGHEATVNQACCVFSQPEKFDPQFFYFWMWMWRPVLISLSSGGGQPNLNQEELKRLRVPIPSVPEQQQIAAFLDWKTGQIDGLIGKKKELLEKLKEKRIAVITQAVTQGLNPAAPLKDSGIPWLGQVPQHWEVKRLKWAVMLQRGHDLPAADRIEGEVPIVSSSGVSGYHDTAAAKAPGIVTGRYGTIGVFHLIEEDYWPLNTTLYSNDLNGNEPRYLRHMLEHIAQLFLLNSIKSAVPGIDRNDVLSLPVAIPDLVEQIKVADHVDAELKKLSLFEEKVFLVIDRLTEYRTALITAATTGKIDVRGVKVPLEDDKSPH